MRILITGGAGFVGSSLALMIKGGRPDIDVRAFDNLRRRGSELALRRLQDAGVAFVHGDVRSPDDLHDAGEFDVLIECSAEPSVQAGYDGSPAYVLHTNLIGTVHSLEAARRRRASVIFISTSRVYPIEGLRELPLESNGRRLDVPSGASGLGWSQHGIAVDFPLAGCRSMYGATKLASELLLEEYRAMYGLHTVVNRCGVVSGPWQMGKVDQGFVVLWASRHLYGGPLTYTGFGGDGLQVRDVLHIADLYELIRVQLADLPRFSGSTFNVGGGRSNSVSLAELTERCAERSVTIALDRNPETGRADVPYYVTDNARVTAATGWAPRRSVDMVLDDVFSWLREHRAMLEPVFQTPAAHVGPPTRAGV